MKTIFLATDFSDSAKSAARYGFDLARRATYWQNFGHSYTKNMNKLSSLPLLVFPVAHN